MVFSFSTNVVRRLSFAVPFLVSLIDIVSGWYFTFSFCTFSKSLQLYEELICASILVVYFGARLLIFTFYLFLFKTGKKNKD